MTTSDEMEKLFLKFAQTDSSHLEKFVNSNLLSVLRGAGGQDDELNKKSLELLTHLNKRLKSNENVELPILSLLDTIRTSPSSTVQNLSMVYVKMGLKRGENRKLIVRVLETAASNLVSDKMRDELFCLIMPILSEFETEESITAYCKHNPKVFQDLSVVARFIHYVKLVMLLPNSLCLSDMYYGMSVKEFNSVKQLQTLDLANVKMAILKFLGHSSIDKDLMVSVFILAFADNYVKVVDLTESLWKRIYGFDTVLTPECCKDIYTVFLGTIKVQGVSDDEKKVPASLQQKLKLMPFLIRSNVALGYGPYNIQLVFEVMFGDSQTSPKLLSYAFDFVMKMIQCSTNKWNKTFGPILFDGVLKFINEKDDAPPGLDNCICQAYLALGELGKRCPAKTIKEQSILAEMLEALSSNKSSTILSGVQDCICMLLPVLKDCSPSQKMLMQCMFASHVQHGSARCRLTALKGLQVVYNCSDSSFLWLVLSASIDQSEDIRREALRMLASIKENGNLPSFQSFVAYIHTQNTNNTSSSLIAKAVELSRYCLLQEWDMSGGGVDVVSHAHSPLVVRRLRSVEAGVAKAYQQLVLDNFHQINILLSLEMNLALDTPNEFWKDKLSPIQDIIFRSTRVDQIRAASELYCCIESRSRDLSAVAQEVLAKTDLNEGVLWLYAHLVARYKRGYNNEMETDEESRKAVWGGLETKLVDSLLSTNCEHACGALSHCLSAGPLLATVDLDSFIHTLSTLVNSRKESVKQTTKEYAAQCLAFVAFQASEQRFQKIQTILEEVGEGPPQLDLQFGIGLGLVDTVLLQYSPSRRNIYVESVEMLMERVQEECIGDVECGQRLQTHLKSIIEQKMTSSNRHLRQSAVIWLFVTLDLCKFHPILLNNLTQLQEAFTDGLAETNDFIQDMASQGLAKVYECCDEKLKKELVANLVESLTAGRKIKAPITGDTKIFSKGALGITPTGDSIATYQELCSLASHLNKPDLIYKFMQLAQHNALWNSKKGAAFGFQTVFEQAEKELEPFLPEIVPKLFRYQYDPSVKVQLAMKSIWKTLTKSRKGVVDEFADAIFDELLICITDKQWRVRESSCLALSDVLSSHCNSNMLNRFDELWIIAFKIIDDIKESVRTAALRTLASLQKVTVKSCSSGGQAEMVLTKCLPILLDTGIKHSIKEIRGASLSTVVSIMKESGGLLKDHVCTLVPPLLESLSELEDSRVSYMATRSAGDQLEMIDNARAAAARSSPSMEALLGCVRYLDGQALQNLLPVLTELVRSSVGLGTRTGTCAFISALCSTCAGELRSNPCVPEKLVASLCNCLSDRNATVRRQSATTIGSLAKFCSSDALKKLFTRLISTFLDQACDPLKRQSLAYVLKGICSEDCEVLKEHATQLVPVVFLAVHMKKPSDEAGTALQEVWDEIWHDLVPGTDSALNLCSSEILHLGKELLDNPSYEMKCSGGQILNAMAQSNANYSNHVAMGIVDALVGSLQGKTYDGKENILLALQQVFLSKNAIFKTCIGNNEKEIIYEVLLKECNKKKVIYKIVAFECLGHFCEQFHFEKGPSFIIGQIAPLISKETELYDSDDEGDKIEREKEILNFEDKAFSVLARISFVKDASQLEIILNLCSQRLSKSYWKTQISIMNCAKTIAHTSTDINVKVIGDFLAQLQLLMEHITNATVSKSALSCLDKFCRRGMEKDISLPENIWSNFLTSPVTKNDDHVMRLLKSLVNKSQ